MLIVYEGHLLRECDQTQQKQLIIYFERGNLCTSCNLNQTALQ